MNGAGEVKVYCINFYAQGVNLWAFTRYLYDSQDIIAFWNYIPLVYCVKSRLSATELTAKLQPFFLPNRFMITEINVHNINGVLSKDAWDWFYLPHHEKNRPPVFPSGTLGAPSLWSLITPPKQSS
jgi:hypothetical protein